MGLLRFYRRGSRVALWLSALVLVSAAAGVLLLAAAAEARLRRDVMRLVYNRSVETVESIEREIAAPDSMRRLLAESPETPGDRPYLVVSIEEHRVWYKQRDSILFTAPVATGSGKVLDRGRGGHWRFETPRGRLIVQAKETDPRWVPPDWHFVEQARKRGLGLRRLERGQSIPLSDGSAITVRGNDVVRRYPSGRTVPFAAGEGRELVVNGNIVIPPFGTTQRRYAGVLGTHRLLLGDGYALHGTNKPETVGRSVSHGCVRLRNEDIARLFEMVAVGTPVYIY
ncbi:MAG TPA: L,D-transpeptidase [Gemmatimonadaceae bacterium]|nr:L,D-transpeptidase [Gemmatimonadaceae bacterium]